MPKPIILATWSFGKKAVASGWPILSAGGSALDAVEQACITVESDPEVDSVGRGGLPDRTGRVSLDGCVMLSPSQCGSVCFIRRYNHPVSIARRVMERTPHVMLAGEGAEAFAAEQGFMQEELLTEAARAAWQRKMDELKKDGSNYERVAAAANREESSELRVPGSELAGAGIQNPEPGTHNPEPHHDTVGVLALDARGTLAGACSTSGLSLKLPGRVGDSPIIGHGLYVHPNHGAAVATGNGELVMGTCLSFLAVEGMRRGMKPNEALHACMQRLVESFKLEEHHQVGMIALTPEGDWAQASVRDGYRTAVRHAACDDLIDAR
ncbi:MAG: isoaspartyl peptidase/L-asparaginase [Phycisphaeraceae bacterium]